MGASGTAGRSTQLVTTAQGKQQQQAGKEYSFIVAAETGKGETRSGYRCAGILATGVLWRGTYGNI